LRDEVAPRTFNVDAQANRSGTGVSPVLGDLEYCHDFRLTGETPVPLLSRQLAP
jgi:hypothetical protein